MWTVLISVILKVLEWVLDYSKANKESKEKYIAFVESMVNQQLTSVKLNQEYNEQLERLKKLREEANKPKV